MKRQLDVPELLDKYRALLVEMHSNRIEEGSPARKWNRLVYRMQAVHLELRQTETGRAGITALASDDTCRTVRAWASAQALFWDEERVRPLIEAEIAENIPFFSFEAEIVLREFDAGRLNMAWVPKAR